MGNLSFIPTTTTATVRSGATAIAKHTSTTCTMSLVSRSPTNLRTAPFQFTSNWTTLHRRPNLNLYHNAHQTQINSFKSFSLSKLLNRSSIFMANSSATTSSQESSLTPPSTTEQQQQQQQQQHPELEDEIDPGEISGTSLRVLKYPHPLLRAANEDIPEDEIKTDEVKQTVKEMLLIMYSSRGVGLAAPQVGINKRLLVFNPEGDSKAFLQEVVMINPNIIATSKKTFIEPEACLSFPGMSGKVKRHEWVKVEGYRLNGKKFKVKFEGWKARIFQHEFDHLQGVLYVDHLNQEDSDNVQEALSRLIDNYKQDPYEGLEPAL